MRFWLLYGKCIIRSQKSAIIDDLMQYVGYKLGKYAITVLTRELNKQKHKRGGRRKILDGKQVDLQREIWAGMGYLCAKLMQLMLQDCGEARSESQDFPSEYSAAKLPNLSAATIDKALTAFKLNWSKNTDDRLDLERLKQRIPIVNLKEEVEKMKEEARKKRFIKFHESLNPWATQNKIAQYSKEIAMLLTLRQR